MVLLFAAKTIHAVIFDLDGLLVDSEPVYRKVWQEAARKCGYELSDEGHSLVIGRGRKGGIEKVAELAGSSFPKEEFANILSSVEVEVFATTTLKLKKGALSILQAFEREGISRAVATSAQSHLAIPRLTQVGLLSYFSVVVCGDEVGRGKPDPEIFLTACKRLEATPSECLVLEDSESGALAGHEAGMCVIMVPDLKTPSDEVRALCHGVFSSLVEVEKVLFGGKLHQHHKDKNPQTNSIYRKGN